MQINQEENCKCCANTRLLLNELIDIGNWRFETEVLQTLQVPKIFRQVTRFTLEIQLSIETIHWDNRRYQLAPCRTVTDLILANVAPTRVVSPPFPTTIVINIHDSYIRVADMGNNRSRHSTRSAATLGRCRGIDISVTPLLDWILTVTEITLISG